MADKQSKKPQPSKPDAAKKQETKKAAPSTPKKK